MPRRYARTNAEAHLYMDLHPCSCGEARFEHRSAVIDDAGVLCSRYVGACRGCGAPREFVFELPQTVRPIRSDAVDFGGSDPSRLLDPGEWMAVSTERAKRQPGTEEDLQFARAALAEVLKFIPAGAERVPDAAFVTERGRAVRDAEPGRFRRVRIEAVLDAWRDLAAKYAAGRPVATASSAAPDPVAAETLAALLAHPIPVLVEAIATAAAKQQGFDGVELRRHASDLAGQIQSQLRRFEIKAAELRQRTRSSAEVERLLDAIARTDTEAGRTVAAHRADLTSLFAGIDLTQLSNSLQTLVAWLRDPSNANQASMQRLLAALQASVAPARNDGDNN